MAGRPSDKFGGKYPKNVLALRARRSNELVSSPATTVEPAMSSHPCDTGEVAF